jgi:hypothetical protein
VCVSSLVIFGVMFGIGKREGDIFAYSRTFVAVTTQSRREDFWLAEGLTVTDLTVIPCSLVG